MAPQALDRSTIWPFEDGEPGEFYYSRYGNPTQASAERALGELDPEEVVAVVDAEMLRALRVISVERGHDPRELALVAFGGAGPLHACALAEELGIDPGERLRAAHLEVLRQQNGQPMERVVIQQTPSAPPTSAPGRSWSFRRRSRCMSRGRRSSSSRAPRAGFPPGGWGLGMGMAHGS